MKWMMLYSIGLRNEHKLEIGAQNSRADKNYMLVQL